MTDGPPESSAAQPIPPEATATRMAGFAKSGPPIGSTDAEAMVDMRPSSIRLFSTCPPSSQYEGDYLRKVKDVADWCDDAGIEGILVYTDNSLVDPWLVSQVILSRTSKLAPLVAIQPAYMHPYTAAKMVTTFSYLYGRRIFLNMVAGGFVNDLIALDDFIEHDDHYDRLVEYVSIMNCLFNEPGPVTFTGAYFAVKNLSIKPRIPPELVPFHKTANVLAALPKSAHPGAKKALAEIWNAEDKDHARAAAKTFDAAYGAKFPKAAAKITDDLDQLLAFYDHPAEHWVHLRTTNPIESTFATVRHRTKVTKGPGSRAAGLAMAFKLIESAQDHWRMVNAPHLVALVRAGATFINGKLVERPGAEAQPEAA